MKGLELSEAYYRAYGADMLREQFPELESLVACGLCGAGSECMGYDDALSGDHDFEPGFCLFLPGTDLVDEKAEFRLMRAYRKLPEEFMGFHRQKLSPVGGNRRGCIRLTDFLKQKTGTPDGNLDLRQWLTLPEQYLIEVTNGRLFRDDLGLFSDIRIRLRELPEDVRLKKLAGSLLLMEQSGQYNYLRCIGHGEPEAAQLALNEFVLACLHTVFLLNHTLMPYYKWSFRALSGLDRLSFLHAPLSVLLNGSNDAEDIRLKTGIIRDICSDVIEELGRQELSGAQGMDLEPHAYAINGKVRDPLLRNDHILAGV